MLKSIENTMQAIASEAYKKTASISAQKTEKDENFSFQREYLQVLVRDYYYSGNPEASDKEKLGKLQKLKASIDSLQLPENFPVMKSEEELSLGSFLKMLEEQMDGLEEKKEEKIKEEEAKIKNLKTEEMENIAAKAEGELTLGDIEKYRHGFLRVTDRKELPPEVLAQIKSHFKNNGIESSPEHEEIARNLLEKGIDLTKRVCCNIDALITAKNKELSMDRVRELAKQYASVKKIDLASWNRDFPLTAGQVENLVNEIQQIDEENIHKIGRNFQSIEEALANYRQYKQDVMPERAAEKSSNQISFQYIRYKMTLEKALTLNSRGIAIDRAELLTIEKELIRLEVSADSLERVADIRGISTDSVLTEMLEVEHGLLNVMGSDYGSLNQMMTNFTLKQVSSLAMHHQAATAMERYDKLGTQVRSDLGDSIHKAIYRLNSLLSANGIEITEENLRAAAILGKGKTEINQNSIDAIKEIDQKLQLVLNGLNPESILELLSQGKDILSMTLEELALWADQKESRSLQKVSERVAKKINRLEKAGKIDENEKQNLILFYRLLSQIEKSEGGAAAFLMKDNRPATLENLYDAAKYLLGQDSFDEQVTGNTGLLQENDFMDLKSQIRSGLLSKKKEIREAIWLAEEEILGGIADDSAGEYLQMLKQYSVEDLERLFTAWKNPTLADAEIYKEFHKIPFLLSDSIRKLEKVSEKSEKSRRKVEEIKALLSNNAEVDGAKVQALLKEMESDLVEAVASEEKQIFHSLMEVKKQWSYQQRFQEGHEFIQLPVWTENQLHQINLYYPKDRQAQVQEKGQINVLMAFELTGRESLSLFVESSSEETKVLLQVDSLGLRKQIRAEKEKLLQIFRENEFPIVSLSFGSFAEKSPYDKENKDMKILREEELWWQQEQESTVNRRPATIQDLEKKMPKLAKETAALLFQLHGNKN